MQSFRRVLLKISGEALMGDLNYGLNIDVVNSIAADVVAVHAQGVQICLVIGGGNIFRGLAGAAKGMERTSADYMGMLATIMNALAMQNALEAQGLPTRVQSAIAMTAICEPYVRRRAVRHMEKGRVVIFAAGLGSPFFTTDTAAALRAVEMNCDVLLKGTSVDGIYNADPRVDEAAVRYETLSYNDIIAKKLRVMDLTAVSMAGDNKLPLVVFNIRRQGSLQQVLQGQQPFTKVTS